MAEESPAGSPLSDLSSDAFEGEEEHDILAADIMPPAKRQKLGDSHMRATPVPIVEEDALSISTDTSGEVPNDPSNLRPDDEDTHEQVTVCSWMDCDAGDLGDMDKLVDHIHNEHIETRQKKYTCEWTDCSRRSMTHASGYALKAHMRSHTREKPFYCALPECDRAFTRSDALAKHMRTVHETEALRPSDPIPKSMQPANKNRQMKLAMKPPQAQTNDSQPPNGTASGNDPPGWTSSYPAELGFTAEEEARGPVELYQLLRRQLHWAEEEGVLLKRQCEALEELRKKEWLEKETLLEQVILSENDYHERRKKVLEGALSRDQISQMAASMSPPQTAQSPGMMSFSYSLPPPIVQDRDAAAGAAVLASLHHA